MTVLLFFLLALSIALFFGLLRERKKKGIIARFLDRLSQGEYSARVFCPSDEEGLWARLNQLAVKIQELREELKRQQDRFYRVLSALKTPLLVLDPSGRVILENAEAVEFFGSVKGRSFWELPEARLREAIQASRKDPRRLELSFRERRLLLSPSRTEEGLLILVFHDLTPAWEMERLKRDLVASVSHELRTPLSALKGYIEAMKEDPDGGRTYLGVLERNVDRLIRLVEDLLSLSQLEGGRVRLQREEFGLKDFLDTVLPPLKRRAEGKGLRFEIEVPEGLRVWADPLRLSEVLFNLVDNAIRFTDHGWVRLRAREDQKEVVLEVSDSGIGIPKEELARIFEPFYVVDKSRSRRTGGTGLGLSIVKSIVELHGGKVEVESRLGEGSTFRVSFPKREAFFGAPSGNP